jgi:hypothetical protein
VRLKAPQGCGSTSHAHIDQAAARGQAHGARCDGHPATSRLTDIAPKQGDSGTGAYHTPAPIAHNSKHRATPTDHL